MKAEVQVEEEEVNQTTTNKIKNKIQKIKVIVDDGGNPDTIRTKTAVKYLGVLLDNKLTFGEQRAREKAATITSSLSRLMANIGGPKTGKRKLLMSVVNSVLLYESEVWADTTKIAKVQADNIFCT